MVHALYKYKVLTLKQTKVMTDYLKEFLALEDLVLHLDIPPKIALERNKGRKGRMINEKFLTVVRKCYVSIFPKLPDQYFTLDATAPINVVVSEAESLILKALKK